MRKGTMPDADPGCVNLSAELIQLPGHSCEWDPHFIFGVSIVSCRGRCAALREAALHRTWPLYV
jgi:hypothetical protein